MRNIRKCRPLQWRNSARARKRLDPIERVRIWRGDASEWLFCDSTVAMCRGALCQGIARKTERADRIQPIGGPDRHFGSDLGHHAQRQSLPCRELTNWDLIRIRKEAKNDGVHVLDFVQGYPQGYFCASRAYLLIFVNFALLGAPIHPQCTKMITMTPKCANRNKLGESYNSMYYMCIFSALKFLTILHFFVPQCTINAPK